MEQSEFWRIQRREEHLLMRWHSVLATIVWLACAAFVTTAVPAADTKPAGWTPELMLKAKGVGEVAVSPDGKRVAFAVSTPVMDGERSEWVSQVFVANADGTQPVQLTRGEKSATNPAWS